MTHNKPDRPPCRPTLLYATTIPLSLNSFFKGQLRFMKEQGFHVVGVSSPGVMLEEVAQREEIPVHGLPMKRGISPLSDLVSLVRLVLLLCREKPAIVNASTPKAGLLVTVAAAAARVPVRVLVLHGLLTARSAMRFTAVLRLVSRISCLLAHQVIAVSHSVARGMIEESLCPAPRIKVLGGGSINGVDALDHLNPQRIDQGKVQELKRQYGIEADSPVIGYVGRIARDKGIVELAQAWQTIRTRWETVRMLVIGPVEKENPVPGSILDLLRDDNRVIMTDYVDHQHIATYYKLMSVLVLPTYREGFPTVLLEAAAMEVPVVATRVTGCVDAVMDGVTGTLVPVRDAQALVHAIDTLLRDRDLAERLGRAGRKRVLEEFQPASIWALLYDEYLRLLREKQIPFVPRRCEQVESERPSVSAHD